MLALLSKYEWLLRVASKGELHHEEQAGQEERPFLASGLFMGGYQPYFYSLVFVMASYLVWKTLQLRHGPSDSRDVSLPGPGDK